VSERRRGRPSSLSLADKHELRRYRESGASIARLAGMWGLSTKRVYEILAEMRERLGPEQLPPEKRRLARLHLFKGQAVRESSATSPNGRASETQP